MPHSSLSADWPVRAGSNLSFNRCNNLLTFGNLNLCLRNIVMDSTLNPCSDDCEKAKAFRRTLDRHRERLQNEIQLFKLRPYLLKRAVLSQGELEQLSNCPPAQRNEELLKTLYGKPNTAMLEFVCCLKEIPKHAELAKLFDQSPGKVRNF